MAHTSALTAWRPEDALLSCPRIQDPAPGPRGRCVRPLTHPAASSRPTTTGRQRDTQADRAVQVEDTTGAHAPCGRVRQSCVMGVGMPGNSRDHYLTLGTYMYPRPRHVPGRDRPPRCLRGQNSGSGPVRRTGPTTHPAPTSSWASDHPLYPLPGPARSTLSDDPPPREHHRPSHPQVATR